MDSVRKITLSASSVRPEQNQKSRTENCNTQQCLNWYVGTSKGLLMPMADRSHEECAANIPEDIIFLLLPKRCVVVVVAYGLANQGRAFVACRGLLWVAVQSVACSWRAELIGGSHSEGRSRRGQAQKKNANR